LRTLCSQSTKRKNRFCAAGLVTAAFDFQVEWLVVKGISNFLDESESVIEDWRAFASVMAASVVGKILNVSIVFRHWPHYQGNDNLADRTDFPSFWLTGLCFKLQNINPSSFRFIAASVQFVGNPIGQFLLLVLLRRHLLLHVLALILVPSLVHLLLLIFFFFFFFLKKPLPI